MNENEKDMTAETAEAPEPTFEAPAEEAAETATEGKVKGSDKKKLKKVEAELAETQKKLEAAEAALAEEKDKYLRMLAEYDNFRRRTAKEQLELIETANGKLLEKLSEVQDNFERAFASENKAQDLEAFEKGMQMIYNQFAKILTDAGLEQIDPTGAEFDPNMHEALMQQPSETVPEGHVVTVFQKGYKLKNKILKTAKVIVSSGK